LLLRVYTENNSTKSKVRKKVAKPIDKALSKCYIKDTKSNEG